MNIWIVEDDSNYIEGLKSLLEPEEYLQCDALFGDAESLLAALKSFSNRLQPDIILLDINLPGKSGIESLVKIKSLAPAATILMLTISEDPTLIFKAFQNGASGYLTKDAPAQVIINAIYEAHNGGMLMPPFVAGKVLEHFKEHKPDPGVYGISTRETQVLELMASGLPQKLIAQQLNLSPSTVNSHIQNIYIKLQVNSGIEAVAKALREKLI